MDKILVFYSNDWGFHSDSVAGALLCGIAGMFLIHKF